MEQHEELNRGERASAIRHGASPERKIMRQRITFVHDATDGFDPELLNVSSNAISVPNLKAAKESRLSFGLHELPQENSFTPIPVKSERFASSTALQYFQLLPSLDVLTAYMQHNACPSTDRSCDERISILRSAGSVDIDYDAISHMLVFKAFWDAAPSSGLWAEDIQNSSEKDKVEVGVLAKEKATEPEELSFSGFLTVVGEDDKPGEFRRHIRTNTSIDAVNFLAPTMFSFPSRHHVLSGSSGAKFVTGFPDPTGLHPILRTTIPSALLSPPSKSCALHAYLTMPSYVFADKYQLSDPLFLASKHLRAVRALYGETDLEAPDWVVAKWGSALLVEIAVPDEIHSGDFSFDLPLHLRYLEPVRGTTGSSEVDFPWPAVFWACDAEEGLKMAVNPFDRVNLGYDGMFGPKTMFYHLEPNTTDGRLTETIHVPALDLDRSSWIEAGTVGAIVLGFAWVCLRLLGLGAPHPGRDYSTSERKKIR
ncbi:MAG: protease B nonderepressible form [Sclerophora amabilis]|nr:MAG: protease B nonderepressible form [Sclerophora amabilis]